MRAYCRVYDSYPRAEQVVRELEAAGVPACDISVVATRAINERLAMSGRSGLFGGLIIMPELGPVVVTGWAAETLDRNLGGSLIGVLVDAGVPEADARSYVRAVQSGGTLVAVRSSQSLVAAILERRPALDSAPLRHRDFSGRTLP